MDAGNPTAGPRDATRPPLVVIALDGGDGDLIVRWASEGHLPNLARLIARGACGDVTGPDSKIDHGLFMSLWSGLSRGVHGYYHFRQLEPGGYRIREVTGRDFEPEPFWAALRGGDLRAAVIDAPETVPIDGIGGVQLCDWAVHEPRHAPSANADWVLREAREVFGPRMVIYQHPHNGPAQDKRLLTTYLDRIERKGRLTRHLLAKGGFDLVVVGYGETHTGGHQFWNYVEQPQTYGALGHGLRSIYAAIDRQVGEILAMTGGDDANVVVFGSVGLIDSFPTDIILETALEKLGYATRRRAPQGLRPLDLARRIFPAPWRKWLTGRLPREMQETLLADLYATSLDWSRTTAFNIAATHNSAVRINLRGREPHGIVEPGAEHDALLDRIEADLMQIVDVVDGLPVVAEVLRRSDLFGFDAEPELPELFINWRPSNRFFNRVRHPSGEWDIPPPNWFRSSYHNDRGWYVAAGPSISGRGRSERLLPTDLAPLFLSLLGLGDARASEIRRKVA